MEDVLHSMGEYVSKNGVLGYQCIHKHGQLNFMTVDIMITLRTCL